MNLAGEPVAETRWTAARKALMRDTIHYRLPAGWLGAAAGGGKVASDIERIFDYRSRQLDQRFGA